MVDILYRINSVPHDKTLDLSELKAFAKETVIVTQKPKFALGRVENIVVKGENFLRVLKSQDCVVKG